MAKTNLVRAAVVHAAAAVLLLGGGCSLVDPERAMVTVVNGLQERTINVTFQEYGGATASTTVSVSAQNAELLQVIANTVMSAWIGDPSLRIDQYTARRGEQEWVVSR